jgi:hypothetical protein
VLYYIVYSMTQSGVPDAIHSHFRQWYNLYLLRSVLCRGFPACIRRYSNLRNTNCRRKRYSLSTHFPIISLRVCPSRQVGAFFCLLGPVLGGFGRLLGFVYSLALAARKNRLNPLLYLCNKAKIVVDFRTRSCIIEPVE